MIQLWPVLAAGLANVVIGFIWYHPKVFGSAWMRMSGITPEMAERGKKRMAVTSFLGLVIGIVIAYVMSYFGYAWGVYDWVGALELGFWCWAGFTATTLLSAVIWEMRPFKLYLINAGYWLVAFMVMACILLL